MSSLQTMDEKIYINSEYDIPKDYMPLVEEAIENQEKFRQDNFEYTSRSSRQKNY